MRSICRYMLTGLMLLWFSSSVAGFIKDSGKIIDVYSGNYLQYQSKDQSKHWVRLIGIVCDEPSTPWGARAKQYLERNYKNFPAAILLGEKDGNGVSEARIVARGKNASSYLLREGFCVVKPGEKNALLIKEQRLAKASGSGRWAKQVASQPSGKGADEENAGMNDQEMMYAMGGMVFLAILIIISRKRAAVLKEQKREAEIAENIRRYNENQVTKAIPVDMTTTVFDVPRKGPGTADSINPQHQVSDGTAGTAQQSLPDENHASPRPSTVDELTATEPLLTEEEKKELEELPEDLREELLAQIKTTKETT